MLHATRANAWSYDHNVSLDGRPLCRWAWRSRVGVGSFEIGGQRFTVRSDRRRSPFRLVDEQGWAHAALEETDGDAGYLLHAEWRTRTMEHRSGIGRPRECLLFDAEQVVGRVARSWTMTEAALPTLALPVQIMLLGVLAARWDAESQGV